MNILEFIGGALSSFEGARFKNKNMSNSLLVNVIVNFVKPKTGLAEVKLHGVTFLAQRYPRHQIVTMMGHA